MRSRTRNEEGMTDLEGNFISILGLIIVQGPVVALLGILFGFIEANCHQFVPVVDPHHHNDHCKHHNEEDGTNDNQNDGIHWDQETGGEGLSAGF